MSSTVTSVTSVLTIGASRAAKSVTATDINYLDSGSRGYSVTTMAGSCWNHVYIIATARVLPKATQRELFRLGAYSRYSQSHY